MKLEIYKETASIPEDEPIRLNLRQEGNTVVLEVVNSNGAHVDLGNLLTISQFDVYFHPNVNKKFGFKRTFEKRLVPRT